MSPLRTFALAIALIVAAGCAPDAQRHSQDDEACRRQPDMPWCSQ